MDIQRVHQLYPPPEHRRAEAEALLSRWTEKGEFEPVVFDLGRKTAEVLKVLRANDKAQGASGKVGKDYDGQPWKTTIRPAPTEAYDRRLDIVYRLGREKHRADYEELREAVHAHDQAEQRLRREACGEHVRC